MKRSNSWNRRDFIVKPAALLVTSRLLGGSGFMFGQSASAESAAPKTNTNAKLITRTLGKTGITVPIVSMGVMNADIPGLLRRCHAALAPEGRVVVQDFILEPEKTAPKSAALFALNMLVGTRAGSTYSDPEYTGWLTAAGFRNVQHVRMPGPASLMVAVK